MISSYRGGLRGAAVHNPAPCPVPVTVWPQVMDPRAFWQGGGGRRFFADGTFAASAAGGRFRRAQSFFFSSDGHRFPDDSRMFPVCMRPRQTERRYVDASTEDYFRDPPTNSTGPLPQRMNSLIQNFASRRTQSSVRKSAGCFLLMARSLGSAWPSLRV